MKTSEPLARSRQKVKRDLVCAHKGGIAATSSLPPQSGREIVVALDRRTKNCKSERTALVGIEADRIDQASPNANSAFVK